MVKRERLCAIILAAGAGTRMQSSVPKVLHRINRRPIIARQIQTLLNLDIEAIGCVLGYRADMVRRYLRETFPSEIETDRIEFLYQDRLLGTADALRVAEKWVGERGCRSILVVSGDIPLINKAIIHSLMDKGKRLSASAIILSIKLDNPYGYGRIIRDKEGHILSIIEERDLSEKGGEITEVNTGVYYFKAEDIFSAISRIAPSQHKGEYYLTDAIKILVDQGKKVDVFLCKDSYLGLGVNTIEDLDRLEKIEGDILSGQISRI